MPIVLVTADDCPACVGFKKANLKELQSKMKENNLKLIHVDLAKRSHLSMKDSSVKTPTGYESISKSYGIPMDFLTMITYFPTLGQFTKDGKYYNLMGTIENRRFVFAVKDMTKIVEEAKANEASRDEKKPREKKKSGDKKVQEKVPPAPVAQKIPDVQRRVMDDGKVVDTPMTVYRMYNSRSVVRL